MNTEPDIVRVLATFGIDAAALLGQGGEAMVYALDAHHVIRIHHAGTHPTVVANRSALLAELAQSAARVPFAIPSVVDTRVVAERIVTVETRLPGRPLSAVLNEAGGEARATLVRAYLDAAARIGDLSIHRPWYGDLLAQHPIRTHTFRAYLQQRAERSLAAASDAFAKIDAGELASDADYGGRRAHYGRGTRNVMSAKPQPDPAALPAVTLEAVTAANWRATLDLAVPPEQQRFVADCVPIAAIALAKAFVRPGDLQWQPFAVCTVEQMVGFIELAFTLGSVDQYWIYHFFIDGRYQNVKRRT